VWLELDPWFVSVFGAPWVGKSFFLAAMLHALRRRLPAAFKLSFTDTDADANQVLCGYEEAVFQNQTPDALVPLGELVAKTQEQGDLYDTARFGDDVLLFPRPFLFTIRPRSDHPLAEEPEPPGRVLCLYDNAGESFLAGRDSPVRPVTRHLAESGLLLFLFDPTQHPPFRRKLGEVRGAATGSGRSTAQQHLVLTEAAARVRRQLGTPDHVKHDRPLVVVVTKQDVWSGLLSPGKPAPDPGFARTPAGKTALDTTWIEERSRAIRALLWDLAPEVVEAAEGFAKTVTYVGVTAVGSAAAPDEKGQYAVRPKDVAPAGAELPLLIGMNKVLPQLVPGGRRVAVAGGGAAG
jgi:hypothetical protein